MPLYRVDTTRTICRYINALSGQSCKSPYFSVRVMADNIPIDAGAPWKQLLADDAAINRMVDRLLAEISLERGSVEISGPGDARALVQDLIRAAERQPA